MIVPDTFEALARAHAYRRKLKFKRGFDYDEGWSKLGSGWYSEAWEHADYPGLVLKVSGREGFGPDETYGRWDIPGSDSWQVYAQYCHKHPHEHLPQILHFERINAAVAWAIMPKYTPLGRGFAGERTRMQWAGWLNGDRGAPEWMWPIIGMASSLCMTVDLHRGNVMVSADGTMIMTDPFSAYES